MRNTAFLPGRGARAAAGLLGFVLTLLLFFAAVLSPVSGVLLSGDAPERAAAAPETLAAEESRIRERLTPLAARYQVDPERLIASIDRERLTAFNRQAAARLVSFLTTGRLGSAPELVLPEMNRVLLDESVFAEASDPDEIEVDMLRAVEEITAAVSGVALQLREPVLRIAERALREKVNPAALIGAVRKLPTLLLAAALAISGLLALTVSRRLSLSLRYIGAAALAAGLLVPLTILLLRGLGLESLLAGASPMLCAEYRLLAGEIRNRMLLISAGLMLPGLTAFLLSGRMNRRGGEGAR